jgi:hypothetical protein
MELDLDKDSDPNQTHQDHTSLVRNTLDTGIDSVSIPERTAHLYGTLSLRKPSRMVINQLRDSDSS